MYRSQKLALKYFAAAMTLFGIMIVAGLMSSMYYIKPSILYNVLDFNIVKILHINGLIIWLLMGFMGSIYWFLPIEFGRETVGIRLGEVFFYIFCLVVLVVLAVFILVQHGHGNDFSSWFINQGRKYLEAPRWASLCVVAVLLVFAYNVVGTSIKAGKVSGIMSVLMFNLIPLIFFYLIAFLSITDMSVDLYWWWWLVHMWVETTWEVLMGCIMALALMQLLNTPRRIVEIWLYIEVALVLGAGILGLGHHYFWIGTPDYWLSIGGFFSALEPLPLLGMVIHAIYDAGSQHMKSTNRPAFYWMLAEAFGNFIGAGVWGFMMTLPQINLFSHGTQWTVSHGHFAFWGAYACGVIAVIYLALQKVHDAGYLDGNTWKWGFALLNIGMVGMVIALFISGMAQTIYERAIGGSSLNAFIQGQSNPWFVEGMTARIGFGVVFAAGYLVLLYDLITVGRRQASLRSLSETT